MSKKNIMTLCGYNIKKILGASVLLCAAAFMTACGFRNDTGTEYTLNGVVTKVVEAEDKIIIRISPVMVSYHIGGDVWYNDLVIPDGSAVLEEETVDAGEEPVFGWEQQNSLAAVGETVDAGKEPVFGKAEYYGTAGLYDLYDYAKSGNVLEYELERTGNYEEILDFAYGAGSRIVKLTVEDGRILGLEETGYRFVEHEYVFNEYGVNEYVVDEYGVNEYSVNEYSEIYD